MFKCLDCGRIFDEPSTYEEHHPYGMGYATETFGCCPYCNGNFEEAKQCEGCGDFFTKDELCNGFCEECEENEIE